MTFARSFKFSLLAIVAAAAAAGAHAEVTVSSSACGDRYFSATKDWPFTGTKEFDVISYALAGGDGTSSYLAVADASGWDWWVQATNMNVKVPAGLFGYTIGVHIVYDPAFGGYATTTYGFNCSSSWTSARAAGAGTAKAGANFGNQAVLSAGLYPLPAQQAKVVPGVVVGSELDSDFTELRSRALARATDSAVAVAQSAAAIRVAEAEFAPTRAKALGGNGLRGADSDSAAPRAKVLPVLQVTPAHIEASELRTFRLVGSKEAGVETAQGWTGLTRLFRNHNEWVVLEELDVAASQTRLVVFKEYVNANVNGNVASLQTQRSEGSALTTLNFVSGTKRIRLVTNAAQALASERLLAIARSLY